MEEKKEKEEIYGIELISKAVKASAVFFSELSEDLSDERFTIGEKVGLLPEVIDVVFSFSKSPDMLKEASDLSVREAEELKAVALESLTKVDDKEKAKEYVEIAFEFIKLIIRAIKTAKK